MTGTVRRSKRAYESVATVASGKPSDASGSTDTAESSPGDDVSALTAGRSEPSTLTADIKPDSHESDARLISWVRGAPTPMLLLARERAARTWIVILIDREIWRRVMHASGAR